MALPFYFYLPLEEVHLYKRNIKYMEETIYEIIEQKKQALKENKGRFNSQTSGSSKYETSHYIVYMLATSIYMYMYNVHDLSIHPSNLIYILATSYTS